MVRPVFPPCCLTWDQTMVAVMKIMVKVKVKSLSCVQLFASPWTVAYQAPLSMDFPGNSTGVDCYLLLQGNLPNPGLKLGSPALSTDALPSEPPEKSEDNGDLLQKVPCTPCGSQCLWPCSRPPPIHPHLHQRLLDTHRQVWAMSCWGHCSFILGPGAQGFVCVLQESVFPSPV